MEANHTGFPSSKLEYNSKTFLETRCDLLLSITIKLMTIKIPVEYYEAKWISVQMHSGNYTPT